MTELKAASGSVIPSIGLGTFPFQGREMADIVKSAVKVGYRLFDTADDYWGEPGIGLAIQELESEGVCRREDLFIETKISDNNAYENEPLKGIYFNPNHPMMKRHTVEEIVREKVQTSLYNLRTSYIDSLLMHYPYTGYYVDIWKAMVKLKEEGLVRYIGVSNFHQHHIERIIEETGVTPSFNQIYVSAISTKSADIAYCKSLGCVPMTYSPLMDVTQHRIDEDIIRPLMDKYRKSMAQIILRWNIDRGCIPLPRSRNPKRMEENFRVFDFLLSEEEINMISSLNKDHQYLVESQICPGI